jgi:hypothetical protein
MAKKIKRFKEGGGYTGDDPIVKYRMGMIDAKGNDLTKKAESKAESKAEPKVETETKQGQNKMIDDTTRKLALHENAPRFITKGNPKSITSDSLVRKDILNEFPNGSGEVRSIPLESYEYDDAGYKKGGKVSSASKRADGCAVKGKTKGRMV